MLIPNPAQLVIVEMGQTPKCVSLNEDQYTIGRLGGANDISLSAGFVSSQHGFFAYENGCFTYRDLASLNGTFVNGNKLQSFNNQPSNPVALNDGDMLSIGSPNSTEKVFILFSSTTDERYDWKMQHIASQPEITIGRDPANTIVIPNINVSRKHAVIKSSTDGVYITDLNSANGTIVNNAIIRGTVQLNNNDVVKVGATNKIVRIDNSILYSVAKRAKIESHTGYTSARFADIHPDNQNVYEEYGIARQGGVEVRVENISRIVNCKAGTGINGSNKKYILQNVSLTIKPGELVAILGGSGAGKTTFMNCINGFEPANEGSVFINSTDLYKNYQSLKSTIGYVPQQDIVHDDLTLESMLTYIGKLRLPKDISKQELKERVAEVMDMVELSKQKDTYIKKMSGGQRKRASIAVELISDPSLFFLDEPTSGLDPEAETNLMRQLQGLSSKKGKTVIVITHTLQNIRLFDKVIFLAPGGKLCFYGTPKEAEQFFGVDNLVDAYEKISSDIDGWVARFNAYANASTPIAAPPPLGAQFRSATESPYNVAPPMKGGF